MEALAYLRCPVTRAPLERRGSELLGNTHRYRVHPHQHGEFVDFLSGTSVDANTEAQRAIYDAAESRYHVQIDADPGFMGRFVADYVKGRVKNKDALLREALLRLPCGPGSLALEIGCNDGRFINVLCELRGVDGLGVDVSTQAVRRAIAHRPEGVRSAFHVAQATQLPLADATVDCIISFDVFEHLGHDAVAKTMKECRRVLRPGGALLVYVVSRNDRFTLHETFRTVSHGAHGVDRAEGHLHENFLLPDEFRAYARAANLTVERLVAYHAFWTLFAEEHLGNRLPAFVYPLLGLLDFPLVKSERGNGFLAVCGIPK